MESNNNNRDHRVSHRWSMHSRELQNISTNCLISFSATVCSVSPVCIRTFRRCLWNVVIFHFFFSSLSAAQCFFVFLNLRIAMAFRCHRINWVRACKRKCATFRGSVFDFDLIASVLRQAGWLAVFWLCCGFFLLFSNTACDRFLIKLDIHLDRCTQAATATTMRTRLEDNQLIMVSIAGAHRSLSLSIATFVNLPLPLRISFALALAEAHWQTITATAAEVAATAAASNIITTATFSHKFTLRVPQTEGNTKKREIPAFFVHSWHCGRLVWMRSIAGCGWNGIIADRPCVSSSPHTHIRAYS